MGLETGGLGAKLMFLSNAIEKKNREKYKGRGRNKREKEGRRGLDGERRVGGRGRKRWKGLG